MWGKLKLIMMLYIENTHKKQQRNLLIKKPYLNLNQKQLKVSLKR